MTDHEKYMRRCLQLAENGRGFVAPNPMVGAVIVYQGRIIGEGYHRKYGLAHAEVNAINAVKDKSLLPFSTIYVSLEPCSHQGKTPPCAQLIIDHKIPQVVVACLDPYPEVSGRGVNLLRKAGIEVTEDVLKDQAIELNKEFITAQTKRRPYIYLKWAQSKDGYIDGNRTDNLTAAAKISTPFTQLLVHKMRSEVQAIMVGTNTAVKDNPTLTTRFWYGHNPIRITIDKHKRIPLQSNLYDGKVETFVFTEPSIQENKNNAVTYIPVIFDDTLLPNIFKELERLRINSIMIEGGCHLLQSLIDRNLWDEAIIETGDMILGKGVNAPVMRIKTQDEQIVTNRTFSISKLINSKAKD